jgi:bZIP transcription factor
VFLFASGRFEVDSLDGYNLKLHNAYFFLNATFVKARRCAVPLKPPLSRICSPTRCFSTDTINMTRSKGPCASDDERKERRRAANRRSARKSRFRETVVMEELQKTVAQLAKQNESLRADNEAFRRDVFVLQGLVANRKTQQLEMVGSCEDDCCHLVSPQYLTKSFSTFTGPNRECKTCSLSKYFICRCHANL